MDYEDEASEYDTSEIGCEEESQTMSDGEAVYGGVSWHEDGYSYSSYEDEPTEEEMEPKPPDIALSHTNQTPHKPEPMITFDSDYESDYSEDDNQIFFSGRNRNPETYHQWEKDVEDWFWHYKIPKEDKMTHALETLTGNAYVWWIKEEKCRIYMREPEWSWEDLKAFVYEEFVAGDLIPRACPRGVQIRIPPRRKTTYNLKPYLLPQETITNVPCTTNSAPIQDHKPSKHAESKGIQPKQQGEASREALASKLVQQKVTEQGKLFVSQQTPELTCYRCKNKGHIAKEWPIKRVEINKPLFQEIAIPKVSDNLVKSDFETPNASIIHLSLSKGVGIGLGMKEKHVATEEKPKVYKPDQTQRPTISEPMYYGDQETAKENKIDENPTQGFKHLHLNSTIQEHDKGFIMSLLIKEEPPDAPHITKSITYQGKTLDSQNRMPPNLLSLNAGKLVLRTKLFEEGGYDAVITTNNHGDVRCNGHASLDKGKGETICLVGQINGEGETTVVDLPFLDSNPITKKPSRHSKEVIGPAAEPELNWSGCTRKTRPDQDVCPVEGAYQTSQEDLGHKPNCSENSTHQGLAANWNGVHRSSDQTAIEFTNQMIPEYLAIEADSDLWSLFDAFQLNHNDSRHETTWKIFTAHIEHASKWNHPNNSLHQGDIKFSNRVSPNLPDLDLRALIGGLRLNLIELIYEPTLVIVLTHHRHAGNWIHPNINLQEKVIQFQNRRILELSYLEPFEFGRLESYVWRPGESLLQLEAPKSISNFILSRSIRWNQYFPLIHQDIPYLKPKALKISYQRLYSDLVYIKGVIKRLTCHGIIQKLSRYKS